MKKLLYRMMSIRPGILMLLSYLVLITLGALFLQLPFSQKQSVGFLDSFFTSTSAVCVTGLVTVDTGTVWTFWGQLGIVILIQLGGLGIMTIAAAIFVSTGRRISTGERLYFQETVAVGKFQDAIYLLKRIAIFTLIIELIGAIVLAIGFSSKNGWLESIWYGFFHSICAFCNAGFSVFSSNLVGYASNEIVSITIMALIVFGGLGFFVMIELTRFGHEKRPRRLSVHTKTVLVVTACLIFFGAMGIYAAGRINLLDSFFQSITARTAGFNTVDLAALPDASTIILIILMFIGASPGSTGGGIKTTSFLVVLALGWSRLRGNSRVSIYRRTIPNGDVIKSVAVFTLATLIVTIVTSSVVIFQSGLSSNDPVIFRDAVFETVSAFGTVGLSLGITPKLTAASKIAIIVTMLLGKVGILTIAYSLATPKGHTEIRYAEENLMIG